VGLRNDGGEKAMEKDGVEDSYFVKVLSVFQIFPFCSELVFGPCALRFSLPVRIITWG
jgi:hypothetical protein